MSKIAAWILKSLGWKTLPLPPDRPENSIICVAPHTSNMDFFIGKLYYATVGTRSGFLMKKEWFFFPLGLILRAMGGIPVDRKTKGSTSHQIRSDMQRHHSIHIAITPEGTRGWVERWHTGFYHMAIELGVPIELAVIDYKRREVGIFEVFYPTGELEADLQYIQSKYTKEQAKYPDLYNDTYI